LSEIDSQITISVLKSNFELFRVPVVGSNLGGCSHSVDHAFNVLKSINSFEVGVKLIPKFFTSLSKLIFLS
jgi:hypothetical protein